MKNTVADILEYFIAGDFTVHQATIELKDIGYLPDQIDTMLHKVRADHPDFLEKEQDPTQFFGDDRKYDDREIA